MTKSKVTPRNKMMDYLARREHSEKELREKLSELFTEGEVDEAIQYGKRHHWIPSNESDLLELAEKTADSLHRKKKGILFINSFLQEKGLPEVQADLQLELEKALELVKNKYKETVAQNLARRFIRRSLEELPLLQQKQAEKVARFLSSRGFEPDTVSQVLNEMIQR
jgi:regulatory protein